MLPETIGTPPAKTVVLFVHGLWGSRETWKDFAIHLKYRWGDNIDCFSLEYEEHTMELGILRISWLKDLIKIIAGGPKVGDIALGLKNTIDEVCKDYKYIIIVGHSMGGLIARKYLLEEIKENNNISKIQALFTYATPHNGSKLATVYKWVRVILFPVFICRKVLFFLNESSSQQIFEMCAKASPFLNSLNSDWAKYRMNSRFHFVRVVGGQDFVVDKQSASMSENNENVKFIPSKGHFNIIKPNIRSDRAFEPLYNYLKEFNKLMQEKELLLEQERDAAEEFDDDF